MNGISVERVLEILKALEEENVRYVLIGGIALNFHEIFRATEDLDLLVDPNPENVGHLRKALAKVFTNDPSVNEIVAEDLASEDYATIRYGTPDNFVIDIMGHIGEVFRFQDIEAVETVVEGIRVRLATPRALYRMKKDTVRGQDRVDAERLRERFHLED